MSGTGQRPSPAVPQSPKGSGGSALGDALTRVRKGGARLLFGSGGANAMDLVATAVLTRHLGVAGFGVFVASKAVSGALHTFITPRAAELVMAFVPRLKGEGETEQVRALQWLAVRLELAATVACVALAMIVGAIAPSSLDDTAGTASWLALAAACTRYAAGAVLSVLQARLKLEGAYGHAAALQLVAGGLRLLAIALMPLVGGGIVACLVADGVGAIIACIAAAVLLPRVTSEPLAASAGPLRPMFRELFMFTRTNWLAATIKGLNAHAPELFLQSFSTAEQVGLFGLARKLGPSALTMAMGPLTDAVVPELYRLIHIDPSAIKAFALRVSAYSLAVLAVLDSLLIATRGPLIELGGGSEFAAAAAPFVVLVLAYSIQLTFYWLRPILLALQRPGLLLVSHLVFAAAMILGSLVLIAPYGALGAAWAMLGAYVCHIVALFVAGGSVLRAAQRAASSES